MNRRDFGKGIVGGAIGAATASTVITPGVATANEARAPKKKALMHVVEDHFDACTVEDFEYMRRHGLKHFEVEHFKKTEAGEWDLDDLKRMRDLADKNDMTIGMFNFSRIRNSENQIRRLPFILQGKSPERDREIDVIIGNIQKAAAVGVPAMRYHWRMTDDYRNGKVHGEGGNVFLSWNLEDNWRDLPMTEVGRVTLDDYWERVSYFLDRIMPVAEEYNVRIACHPPDPPLPPGYRGIDHWNYDMFDGLKKYASLTDSPNFGFLLCIGTVGEGLVNPGGDELLEIVRYFGERKKIFTVHLRNIRGSRDHFSEWYPDSGDMDFYKVMKILRDVEYPYAVLPDHMPSIPNHPDDPRRKQAYAYGFGYIKAMIQAVNSEA